MTNTFRWAFRMKLNRRYVDIWKFVEQFCQCLPNINVRTAMKHTRGSFNKFRDYSHNNTTVNYTISVLSVLWRCWLNGRKGIRPVKTSWWDAGVVICQERGADLYMAQLMPLPLTISCSRKSRLVLPSWFHFLVPAHPGSPGQSPGGHKMVVVVVVWSLSHAAYVLSLIHIWRCRRIERCRSRWSPYH